MVGRAPILHDKITDGRKRRTDNHPVMDLPSVDGTQLLVDGHPEINHTPNPTWARCGSEIATTLPLRTCALGVFWRDGSCGEGAEVVVQEHDGGVWANSLGSCNDRC